MTELDRPIDRPITADPLWYLGISIGLIVLFVILVSVFTEQQWVIDYGTADVCTWVMRLLGFDASTDGRVMTVLWNGESRSANVEYGCNGLLMYLLLTATMVTFPVAIGERTAGLIGGLIFAFCINQFRLVALMIILFFVEPKRFEIYHTGFGQAFAILSVATYWWLWLRFRAKQA